MVKTLLGNNFILFVDSIAYISLVEAEKDGDKVYLVVAVLKGVEKQDVLALGKPYVKVLSNPFKTLEAANMFLAKLNQAICARPNVYDSSESISLVTINKDIEESNMKEKDKQPIVDMADIPSVSEKKKKKKGKRFREE